MSLQIINSTQGFPEYVLLPINIYNDLRLQIDARLDEDDSDYVPFVLENYVKNPAALARIKANVTQGELAEFMDVTQAYVSKIERQKIVTAKTLKKVHQALQKLKEKGDS
jgi:DNA-binding XRE family transcriptional regulator